METTLASDANDRKGFCTERLCLREARESDLIEFHAIMSNDDVMKYWYVAWIHSLFGS